MNFSSFIPLPKMEISFNIQHKKFHSSLKYFSSLLFSVSLARLCFCFCVFIKKNVSWFSSTHLMFSHHENFLESIFHTRQKQRNKIWQNSTTALISIHSGWKFMGFFVKHKMLSADFFHISLLQRWNSEFLSHKIKLVFCGSFRLVFTAGVINN